MKKLILVFFLLLGLNAMAGGFRFPNVEFSYAKLYLFNLNLDQPHHMAFRIYQDQVYAPTKLGNGWKLSNQFHEKLQDALARGVDELIMGLGKCYMPRHGIIYYDAEHNPVASLSICFECDRIAVWSKEPYSFSEDYSKFNYDKAEKQMAELAEIIRNENLPVYTSVEDERKYFLALARDTNFFKASAKLVHATDELGGLTNEITIENIKQWSVDQKNFSPGKDTVDARTNVKLSQLRYGKDSHFLFEGDKLHFAHITHPEILLPNGISIGMSAAEVYRNFDYKDPENGVFPTRLNILGGWNVQLEFEHQTLVGIMIHPDKN